MKGEIIQERWRAKDTIAARHRYDMKHLADHLNSVAVFTMMRGTASVSTVSASSPSEAATAAVVPNTAVRSIPIPALMP